MESRAEIPCCPAQQMMMPSPCGLLATAVIFGLVYLVSGNLGMGAVAHSVIVAGIVCGLVALPLGPVDYLAIPQRERFADAPAGVAVCSKGTRTLKG